MKSVVARLLITAILFSACADAAFSQTVRGDLQRGHTVVVDFPGPATSETADPNPFTDFRLNMTFIRPDDRKLLNVGDVATAAIGQQQDRAGVALFTWHPQAHEVAPRCSP